MVENTPFNSVRHGVWRTQETARLDLGNWCNGKVEDLTAKVNWVKN